MKPVKQSSMRPAWLIAIVGLLFLVVGLLFIMGDRTNLEKTISWFILVMGLFLIYLAYFTYRTTKQSYQEFYQLFPELNENIETALDHADYVSEPLGLLVYKGYLVNYRRGLFSFVSLKEVVEIGYRWVSKSRVKSAQAFLLIQISGASRVKYMEVVAVSGTTGEQLLKEFYSYLQQKFQQIHVK